MARIREIKPDFFLDEELADVPIAARLCFIGLWTLADKAGRLEDRPARIRAQLFPYDSVDIGPLLAELATRLFILRYEVEGRRYIEIRSFRKHQRPHPKEKDSAIPPPPDGFHPDMPCPDFEPDVDLEPDPETASREISRQAVEGLEGQVPVENLSTASRAGSSGSSGSSAPGISAPWGVGGARARDPSPPPWDYTSPRLGEAPIDAQAILRKFGTAREKVLNSIGFHVAGPGFYRKAQEMAESLCGRPEDIPFVEPTMQMLLEEAKTSSNPKHTEAAFSFGSWVAQFCDLRDRMKGLRKGPKASTDVECAFHAGGKNSGRWPPKEVWRQSCAECRHIRARDRPRAASEPEAIGDAMQAR